MNEMMRREDAPLLVLVSRWELTYHKYLAAEPAEREGLADQIAALEGQIARYIDGPAFDSESGMIGGNKT